MRSYTQQQTGRGIQSSGQIVFEAGPHDFDDANFDQLCAYLAGDMTARRHRSNRSDGRPTSVPRARPAETEG